MRAKYIPTNGKHILKPPVRYITKVKQNRWDLVGVSYYADLEPLTNSALMQFQDLII